MTTPEHTITAEQQPPWDIPGAQNVLHADTSLRMHALYGSGYRLHLRDANSPVPPTLDLFPERLVARYRTELVRVELRRVARVQPADDHLLLTTDDPTAAAQSLLYPDGTLTLAMLSPGVAAPAGSPQPSPESSERTTPEAPDAPSPPEKAPRVVLNGRVGRAAQLRTTTKGRVIARVPLAVHLGEETAWHTILFFDEAAQHAEGLIKGQLVTVIGYRHTRETTTRAGETRQVEEIYGVSVQGAK
jgi:hypothetical protein